MKKKLFAPFVVASGLLYACGGTEYEAHQTYFYPTSGAVELYADQTADTLHVVSLDSWTAECSVPWLTVSPAAEKIPSGYRLDRRLDIKATANTTGKNRMGHLAVQAYGNTFTMPVVQTSWLNVILPQPQMDSDEDFETRRPTFAMNLKGEATDTVLVFRTYEDGATLRVSDAWLTPEASTFPAGQHRVRISLAANFGTQPRQTRVTLTSAGISTDIDVHQRAAE